MYGRRTVASLVNCKPPEAEMTKLYAERNPRSLGRFYTDHVEHMTSEGLHDKAEIAAELAYRDQRIMALQAQVDALMMEYCPGDMTENTDTLMEDAATIILKLKDTLAENGVRPDTPWKAKMWDEACVVYERMGRWAYDRT